uniref:Transposase n=1 Tax=Pyricularia grisea TaxID=148305 RepID=Q01165_PYRGI|nr:transposase [Pyricularia grisea]
MKQYTEKQLISAINDVNNGNPIAKTSRKWGIPRSTLQSRLKGSQPYKKAQSPFQRLSTEQEKHLADWVLTQTALGLPPTHQELRFFAERILQAAGETKGLGKRWITRFLARYPILKTQRPRRIDNARVNGATTEVIKSWWLYITNPVINAIKPENRWNMDETGIMEGKGSNGLVLGLNGIRPLQRKEPGTRGWTTIIECISATGVALPPLVIFKGKNVQQQWFPTDLSPFDNWQFHATENGWTNNQTAIEWLKKVFIPYTQPLTPEKRLLVLDGHGSHITDEFMLLCLQNNIQLLYLPPHSSHVLQPLDLSVFGPLKEAYRRQLGFVSQFCCSTVIGKRNFLLCYRKARLKAFIAKTIQSGWRTTGLWPVNLVKPLLSPFLLENSNANVIKDKNNGLQRDKTPESPAQKINDPSLLIWKTPKTTRDIRLQLQKLSQSNKTNATSRLLFAKVQKSFEAKDTLLASAQQKISLLEAQLEAIRPVKRRRVVPDPNELLVNKQNIIGLQENDIENLEPLADEEEVNEPEKRENDCIFVR